MAGFNSLNGDTYGEVMSADNACFDGTARGTLITTDGQLWIGSTVAPHIRVGNITSTGGTITVTPGHGTINLDTTGQSSLIWSVVMAGTLTAVVGHGYIIRSLTCTVTLPNPGVGVGGQLGFISGNSSIMTLNAAAGQAIQIGTASGATAVNTNNGDAINLIWTGSGIGSWYSFGGPEGVWNLS